MPSLSYCACFIHQKASLLVQPVTQLPPSRGSRMVAKTIYQLEIYTYSHSNTLITERRHFYLNTLCLLEKIMTLRSATPIGLATSCLKNCLILFAHFFHSLPTFHFVYYQNSCRQAQPCFVVIWWENHNQIFVYPLPSEPGKNAPPTVQLHWLLPQASPVVCSAISSDSKLLAAAQGTGVVTVWNFQTYFCESVSVVAPTPDSVTCMVFFSDDSMIGVGTEQGNVMVVCTGSDRNKPPFSLNQRYAEYPVE